MAHGKPKSALRIWPVYAVAAVAAVALVWIWLPSDAPFRQLLVIRTAATIVVSGIALLLWWLSFSHAPGRLRLLGLLGLASVFGVSVLLFEIRGVSGDLVPRVAWRGEDALPMPPRRAPGQPRVPEPVEPAEVTEPGAAVAPSEPEPEAVGAPVAAGAADPAPAHPLRDFAQFLGPNRDATVEHVSLSRDWDATAPAELWRQPIGLGWSGFAVASDIAVTLEQRQGEELIVAYALQTGQVLWSQNNDGGFESAMTGHGPRSTPAIGAGRVFVVGARGTLTALELETGEPIFRRNILEDSGGRPPSYGVAASPLLLEDLVVVLAGGEKGASLVAYDRISGERRWSGGDDPAAYSSPFLTTLAGLEQIVVFNQNHVAGQGASDGKVLWQFAWPRGTERVAQPVVLPGDRLFVSSGYGIGSKLLEIEADDAGGLAVKLIWESRRLKAKFTQVVHKDGFMYGLDDGILVSLDLQDGERRWKRGRYGHGQILLVDDLLLVQSERGEVVLVEPRPERHIELGRFQAVEGMTWATMALAGDLLIVRSETEAACYRLPTDISAGSAE